MDAKEWIDKHESEFIHDICELIKIPSVSKKSRILGMPFGKDCFAALEKSLEIAKRMGFKTFKNVITAKAKIHEDNRHNSRI